MANNIKTNKTFLVVAYDICNDKRLRRLHKQLKKYGIAVQYSIFETILSRTELAAMKKDIRKIIKPKKGDRVRYYFLCETCRQRIESTDGMIVSEKPAVFV
ncbi:MAG: CRISPR-associated endonuclease Cas2 [Calditrichaeota bacterium]|nr:MAG: CRISPR-associated endonuclease Cas2 [Calditrichota bacterium]